MKGFKQVPIRLLEDLRDSVTAELINFEAAYEGYHQIEGSRWHRDWLDLKETVDDVNAILAKPEARHD